MSTTIVRGKQVPYIKVAPSLDAFEWTGQCSRITGLTEPLGDVEYTHCRSPIETGKYVVDGETETAPDATESSLIMKKSVANLIATLLKTCRWNVDVRYQPSGAPGDPLNWQAIDRMCGVKFTQYETDDETSMQPDDEGEVMITAPFKAPVPLYHLWRLSAGLIDSNKAGDITAVANAHPKICPTKDEGPGQDCEFIVGTAAIGGHPYVGVSTDGGDTFTWTFFDGTNNTPNWTGGIVDIAAQGDLIIVVSTTDAAHAVSQDGALTWTEVTLTDYAANAPTCVDIYSPNAIWIGGENGYIWKSTNSGLTASTSNGGDAGVVTSEDFKRIRSYSDKVVFAVGTNNAIVHTLNGGRVWGAITGPAAQAAVTINGLVVETPYKLLLVYNDGEAYWTDNRGAAAADWQRDEQVHELALTSIGNVAMCGCERYMFAGTNETGVIYENVHGAPDKWEQIAVPGDVSVLLDIDCCHENLYLAVGETTYVGGEGSIIKVAA